MLGRANLSPATTGLVAAIASVLILSTTGVVIRYLSVEYGLAPLVLAFWRNVFLVLFLGLYLKVCYPSLLKLERRHMPFFVYYGFILSLFNVTWNYSVAATGASIATVLVCLSPVFTLFLARIFLKETLTVIKVLVVAIAFVGAFLVTGNTFTNFGNIPVAGVLWGLMSALCYSGYSLFGRISGNKGLNPWTALLYTFAAAAVFIFIYNRVGFFLFAAPEKLHFFYLGTDLGGWGYLLLLALGPTLLGFGLCNVSLSKLPATNVSLIMITEPIFTMILAFYLLGEWMSSLQIFGSLLIIGAVGLLYIYENGAVRKEVASRLMTIRKIKQT